MNTDLTRKDLAIIIALGVSTFLLYCYGLGNLEFFRHTEADRTLIGWSMLEAGNFAIPNILGTSIFTKPPLFYWIVAGAIYLSGNASEMAVRMPSIIIASLFVMTQYIILRKANFNSFLSFIGALFLCSSVQFARVADAVEIDMTFAFLCSTAFVLMFFAISRASFKLILGSYAFAGLAFLTKGYPIIGFMGGITIVYYFLRIFIDVGQTHRSTPTINPLFVKFPRGLQKFVIWNCLGVIVFCLIISVWVYFVLQQPQGPTYLNEYLLGEFKNRIADSGGRKSAFFYLPVVLTSAAPWSILLVIGLVVPFFRKLSQNSYRDYFLDKNYRNFFLFNLTVLLVGVVLLSIPAGKADRYFMPLLSATINLSVFGLIQIKNSKMPDYLYGIGKYLCIVLALVCAFFPVGYLTQAKFAAYIPMIENTRYILLVLFLCGWFACIKKSKVINVAVIILALLAWRYIFAVLYVEARNKDYSVKNVVNVIDKAVPAEKPIYFEVNSVQRWFAYYLKRSGRNVYILSSAAVENINNDMQSQGEDEIYIVINLGNFNKLKEEFAGKDGYQDLAFFPSGKHSVVLIKVNSSFLSKINTKQYIEWI